MAAVADPARPVREAASVEELLAGATDRRPLTTGDALSGCSLDSVVIGGERFVVKHLCRDQSWLMRASGDIGTRQLAFWRSPLIARMPECIDHATVGFAANRFEPGCDGLVLLLRDVSASLVPAGGTPVSPADHLRFLDHMAALHARFWGLGDGDGLVAPVVHYTVLTSATTTLEAARGGADPVPPLIAAGWAALRDAAPRAAPILERLLDDPWPLVEALASTPTTLVHGDWKMGNLGAGPDGRTILLDWDRPSAAAACMDLAWYLAVNCDRLPISKEASIAHYRRALEARGVRTAGWWDAQLALSLLGGALQLGWAKAGGDPAEMGWWEDRAVEARRLLG